MFFIFEKVVPKKKRESCYFGIGAAASKFMNNKIGKKLWDGFVEDKILNELELAVVNIKKGANSDDKVQNP